MNKPVYAWSLFVESRFAYVKELHPGIHDHSVSHILGCRWNNMSEAEKQPWIEQAKVRNGL